ncbi:MAG: tRNA 2-thiouridine(34) synthase MnmA [Clostridia bacterium]|nr:tRNA 2-thiouridine(34) synthase MnmA [Clostridia bacterium]
MKKALIAMSGGVDSSVAALLVKESGIEAVGCTMRLYDAEEIAGLPEPGARTCCSLEDTEDAGAVARRLGIPYHVFNFKSEFREKVMVPFARAYLSGSTPNPCIECNRHLKFAKLLERAEILGCGCVVTGHYARIDEKDGRMRLLKAKEPEKDQSYVLYQMDQYALRHTLFPLGELSKEETRRIAEEHGFLNARKPDSQDICFVPDGDYARVVEALSGVRSEPGDFVLADGTKLGRHKGVIHYTVGQRRGLGIAGPAPYYVIRIDPAENRVVLGFREELYSSEARLAGVNWIAGNAPGGPCRCGVRIRYHHPEEPATVFPGEGDTARVVFDEPQRAVTPGQAAVFYEGEEVLGGGVILPPGGEGTGGDRI